MRPFFSNSAITRPPLFDGATEGNHQFHIGESHFVTNLTQLVLGVDRDSEIVAPIFDERNCAGKSMISRVIEVAGLAGRKIGICGQAPSDHPDFAQFLVEHGIDSISLNPDVVLKTPLKVLEIERAISREKGRDFRPRRHSPSGR